MKLVMRASDGERRDIPSAIAARQHGVVARDQLLAAGMSRSAVGRRLADGRLQRLHRSVYAVGHAALRPQGVWLAGVLACGPGAVLSHRSGGAGWGIFRDPAGFVDVTTVASTGRGQPGIAAHSCQLHPDDVTTLDGIPITTAARVLLDLGEVVPVRQVLRAATTAETLGLFDLVAIEATLDRAVGRRGAKPLRLVLDELVDRPTGSRRELEERALDLVRAAGLPNPVVNTLLHGHEVDLLWREQRLVVELDSWTHHRSRPAFEADRRRDADLQLAGYRVLRCTWRQVALEPEAVVSRIRALLTPFSV